MARAGYADVVAMTHEGALRRRNEDTILVGRWVRGTPMQSPQRFRIPLDAPVLCLVADGMGGHRGGPEASRHACEALAAVAGTLTTEDAVAHAVNAVSDAITKAGRADPALLGMGSTVAGVVLLANGLLWFNVGDSPVFRYRDGFLRQVSTCDVPLGDRFGQRSHRITQCLGGDDEDVPIAPHTGVEPRDPNWRYLVASDGLTDMVPINRIEAALELSDPVETVCQLHADAMAAGGHDNISILLVSWLREEDGEAHGD